MRWICWRLGFNRPILWSTFPHVVGLVGKLKECFVVYYCVDNFTSMPGIDVSYIKHTDETMTRIADLVFVTSETMLEIKRKINPQTYAALHGVDLELFAKAMDPSTPLPEELKGLPRPLIGYIGAVERWVDLGLIRYIAVSRPQWSLVIVGRVVQEISELRNLSNIYFLGPRPYEELPEYAKAFDVALIPYILNEQTLHANPIKLREYLAAGRPVVAVRTPDIEKFAHVVSIADTYEEFLMKIERALAEDTPWAQRQRMESVQGEDWDKKVERVSSVVRARMEGNPPHLSLDVKRRMA